MQGSFSSSARFLRTCASNTRGWSLDSLCVMDSVTRDKVVNFSDRQSLPR